jgi:hypothetical protein
MLVRRIVPLSLAKVAAVLYAGLGLIIGALVTVFALVGSSIAAASEKSPVPLVGVLFGAGAIVLLPILYGILGFVGGLIWSGLYNLAARFVGGVELEVSGH